MITPSKSEGERNRREWGGAGQRNSNAAAVVTSGFTLRPEVVNAMKNKGRTFTRPYEEEAAAMKSALPGHPPTPTVLQSPYSLAQTANSYVKLSIHNSINSILSSTFIQWIPGHFVIPGNNLVDKATNEATTIVTDTILPVSFSSSIQVIN